jgi:hypothetical protein
MLTPLPVDLADLCIALEAEASGYRWYFDLETGETILLNGEYDPEEHDGLTTDDIKGRPQRFRRVPTETNVQALADMKGFADSLEDGRLKESLLLALAAVRPERRFRAVLGWLPDELGRWHRFRHALLSQRAMNWLEGLGVRAVPPEHGPGAEQQG